MAELIKYLRIYFIDTSTTVASEAFTLYPGQNTSDLVLRICVPHPAGLCGRRAERDCDNSAYATL
jgi:hypothetical protein